MKHIMLASLCAVAVLELAACSGGCADVALNRVEPSEQTLLVGQSITLTYETGSACRSGDRITDTDLHQSPTVWHTADTLVVALDTLTGRVTGRAPGDATIISGGGSSALIHVQ